MGLLVWFTGFAVVLICIIFCGDPRSQNILGRLNRAITIHFPDAIYKLLMWTHLVWIITLVKKTHAFLFLQRNPFVLFIYLLLTCGSFGAVILYGYPHLPNMFLGAYHRYIGNTMMIICLFCFYKAATVDGGTITKDNLGEYDNYAYDNVLYESSTCPTCKIPKLARSKHCKIMNVCISKFDHYCIWLNRAVGERNYRWFYAFLVTHVMILLYGIIVLGSILLSLIYKQQLLTAVFVDRRTGERFPATYGMIFQLLLHENKEIMFVFVLCVVMGLVLTGFTGYHTWLTMTNTTTNETFKWSAVHENYEQLQHMNQFARRELPRVSAELQRLLRVSQKSTPTARSKGASSCSEHPFSEDNSQLQSQESEHESIEARISNLRHTISKLETYISNPPPREMPQNIYDIGWQKNFKEMIFPYSLRSTKDAKYEGLWIHLERKGTVGPTHSSSFTSGSSSKGRRNGARRRHRN